MEIVITYTNRIGEDPRTEGEDARRILAIQSLDFYTRRGKSREEILNAIEDSNKNFGYQRFKLVNAPDELNEIFDFALGEKRYKGTTTMDDLRDRLDEAITNLEGISTDVFNALDGFSSVRKKLEDVIKDVKEKCNDDD